MHLAIVFLWFVKKKKVYSLILTNTNVIGPFSGGVNDFFYSMGGIFVVLSRIRILLKIEFEHQNVIYLFNFYRDFMVYKKKF